MTCEDSALVPNACSCQLVCPGDWVGPLQASDSFTVELSPAPGALPEPDPAGDLVEVTVPRPTVGFNRFVRSVDISPSAESPGDYHVHVESAIEVLESAPVDRDLSWTIAIRRTSGDLLAEIPIPVNVPAQDVGTCGGLGCPGPCGTGHARNQQVQ